MKKCPNCDNLTDSKFCPECGLNLAEVEDYEQAEEATISVNTNKNATMPEPMPLQDENNSNEPSHEQGCTKKRVPEETITEEADPEKESTEETRNEVSKNNFLKGKKWIPIVVGAIIVLIITFFSIIQPKVIKPTQDYNYAIEQLEKGNIAEAKKVFGSLGDFKDSVKQLDNCEVALGDKHLDDGEYEHALEIYEKYRDNENVTEKKINECKYGMYNDAIELYVSGDTEKARQQFLKLGNYSQSERYVEICDNAIEEAAAKKAAEEKAAAEKAAKYGKLDSSLSDIMKVYIDKYSSIHAYSGSTAFGASLNLSKKDNAAYGGIMTCSPSNNSVAVMFSGMNESGSSEVDVNDIPGSILTVFYARGKIESEDLMCMITAESNLLSAIDPSITQEEAYDVLVDAYLDEKEVSFKGFKIIPADMLQSENSIVFKIYADK